jgi:hypothetical protein
LSRFRRPRGPSGGDGEAPTARPPGTFGGDIVINNSAPDPGKFISADITATGFSPSVGPFTTNLTISPPGGQTNLGALDSAGDEVFFSFPLSRRALWLDTHRRPNHREFAWPVRLSRTTHRLERLGFAHGGSGHPRAIDMGADGARLRWPRPHGRRRIAT